jgi:hypothetical protein
MMRDSEVFAFACPTIIFFTVPFLFGAYVRYLRYRETLALADRGLLRERRNGNGHGSRGTFRWGILLTAVGMALCLGLWPLGFMVGETPFGLGPWLLPGLLAASIGVAFIVIHYLGGDNDRYQPAESDEIPAGKG